VRDVRNRSARIHRGSDRHAQGAEQSHGRDPATDIGPRIASMIAPGIFPAERVVTDTIDAADVVRDGFAALLDPSGKHLKIMVAA
jgi:hypothetical protein